MSDATASQPAAKGKKAPAKKAAASSSKQTTLTFAPSQRAPRAAAARGRKKTADVVSVPCTRFSTLSLIVGRLSWIATTRLFPA